MYGVYKFLVDYRRIGYTHLYDVQQVGDAQLWCSLCEQFSRSSMALGLGIGASAAAYAVRAIYPFGVPILRVLVLHDGWRRVVLHRVRPLQRACEASHGREKN